MFIYAGKGNCKKIDKSIFTVANQRIINVSKLVVCQHKCK